MGNQFENIEEHEKIAAEHYKYFIRYLVHQRRHYQNIIEQVEGRDAAPTTQQTTQDPVREDEASDEEEEAGNPPAAAADETSDEAERLSREGEAHMAEVNEQKRGGYG